MTVHVSGRSISALLLLSVSLLGLPAEALAQSVGAPQKAAPTLAERLDRLAAEFDRNRIDLHVPGAVLAIVRGEEVIFARGFGVADIERRRPSRRIRRSSARPAAFRWSASRLAPSWRRTPSRSSHPPRRFGKR